MTRNDPLRMRMEDAMSAVRRSDDGLYGVLMTHGTLEIGFYRPQGSDLQSPHDRDEVYIVAAGHGRFECGDRTADFEAGEALFVPAGKKHRFVEFSEDFAAWVLFYGPSGGELPSSD